MSTKTIKHRIALVAVSALTAGLFTAVSAPASVALDNATASSTNADSEAGTMNVATQASVTGAPIGSAAVASADARSVGLVNVSDLVGGQTAGTTQTATLVAGGSVVVYSTTVANSGSNADNQAYVFTVTGGTLSIPRTANANGATAMAPGNTAAFFAPASASSVSVAATPNSGVTQMIVRMYSGQSQTATGSTWGVYTSATTAATALALPTRGTLAGQLTVNIVAASAAGVASTAKSGVYYNSDDSANDVTADDVSGPWLTKSPTAQHAVIRVRDSFGTPIASTSGLLQASATNGALVSITQTNGATGTGSTAFYTNAAPDLTLLTVAAPSFAPLTTVVTVSYNGVVIGTKSFTFTGPVTSVTVSSPSRINRVSVTTGTSGSGGKGAVIKFADSAGNPVYVGDSYYSTSGFASSADADRTAILSIAPSDNTTTGYVDWGCNSTTASTDNLIVTYTNTNGSVATSNTVKVSCAGDPYTYTASYDKASYAPGEVAVLTVSFKDGLGNVANDISSWSSTIPTVSIGGGTIATAPTTSDASALGVKTYNIITIVTEGTYQTVVSLPVVKTANSSQKDVIAGFTLKAQGTTVSNADVLKSIVSLIASINKQIQALQKLILKR